MTTTKAMRLASLVTAINVVVASGFSIAAIIRPQYLLPANAVPTEASLIMALYAAARTIPLAVFVLAAIYKRATSALMILGVLAKPCNCWTRGSVCLSMTWGNARVRSLLPSSNSWWWACFTDLCGRRHRPRADERAHTRSSDAATRLAAVNPADGAGVGDR